MHKLRQIEICFEWQQKRKAYEGSGKEKQEEL